MSPDRLLRISAVYHGFVGAVFLLLPGDTLRSLAMEPPRHWLLYYAGAAAPMVAAFLLESARRKPKLRPGVVVAVQVGNLTALALVVFFTVRDGLPRILLGTAVAAGLWAWLLGGVYSGADEEDA